MSAPPRCERPNGLTKRIYRSQAKARQAAVKLQGTFGRKARAYECQWCGGWHVTGQPDKRSKS